MNRRHYKPELRSELSSHRLYLAEQLSIALVNQRDKPVTYLKTQRVKRQERLNLWFSCSSLFSHLDYGFIQLRRSFNCQISDPARNRGYKDKRDVGESRNKPECEQDAGDRKKRLRVDEHLSADLLPYVAVGTCAADYDTCGR